MKKLYTTLLIFFILGFGIECIKPFSILSDDFLIDTSEKIVLSRAGGDGLPTSPFYTVNLNDGTLKEYTKPFSTERIKNEIDFQAAENLIWRKTKHNIDGIHYSYETVDKKYLFAVGLPMYIKFGIIFRTGGNSLYIINEHNLKVKQIFLKDKLANLRVVGIAK